MNSIHVFLLSAFSAILLYCLPSPAQTVTMAPGQDKQYLKMIKPEDIEPVPGYQIVYGKLNGMDAARTSRGENKRLLPPAYVENYMVHFKEEFIPDREVYSLFLCP